MIQVKVDLSIIIYLCRPLADEHYKKHTVCSFLSIYMLIKPQIVHYRCSADLLIYR